MDKICARCHVAKPVSDFYTHRQWKDGLHPYCKRCLLDWQRDRRLAKLDAANPFRRRWTKWSVKHDYFSDIGEPVAAYLLGILAADGNVLDSTPRLTLELSVRDVEIVELLRDQIAPRVSIRSRPPRGCSGAQAILSVTSQQLIDDLARWGVVPRKSSVYEWPQRLHPDLLRPYLLGHFDGDGFITIAHRDRRRPSGRWGLLGTRPFLEDAMKFIESEIAVRPRQVHQRQGVHRLLVTGRDALAIDHWLHRGFEFGLARKQLKSLLDAASAARESRG